MGIYTHKLAGLLQPNLIPAAGGVFTPNDLAGLVRWYRAESSGKITLNSGRVSNWEAENDASNDLAQATAGRQPLYAVAEVNGKAAVEFSRARNDQLITPSVTHNIGTGDCYIALVAAVLDFGNRNVFSIGNWLPQLYTEKPSGVNTFDVWFGGSQCRFSSFSPVAGTYYVIEIWRDGTSVRMRLNGVMDSDSRTASTDCGAAGTISLGTDQTDSDGLDGGITEFILCDGLPTNRDDNLAYLASEYGISV